MLPKLEALAIVKGERLCTNDDIIRNTAYNWSLMSAQEEPDRLVGSRGVTACWSPGSRMPAPAAA